MDQRWFLALLSSLSAIAGFLFGYDTGVISGALVLIKDKFDLSDVWQEAIVASTVGVAGLFSLVGGVASEMFGRKPLTLVSSFVFTLGALIMALCPNKEVLLVGRLVVGIGLGLASMTAPMYIGEVAPANIRGKLITVNTAMITGGQLVASIVDGIFSGDEENGWRFMLGLAAIPSMVQFVGFSFMPESPVWLAVRKNTPAEAEKVLRKIRSEEELEVEVRNLNLFKEIHENEPSTAEKLRMMLAGRSTKRALITGCMLQVFQQLSGINTFMYYSASILESSGIGSTSQVIWLAVIPAAANFIFTFLGMALVERIGRRKLSMASLSVACLGLVCLSGSFFAMTFDDPSIGLYPNSTSSGDNCASVSSCSSCISTEGCGFCFHKESSHISHTFCLPYEDQDDDYSSRGPCSNSSVVDSGWLIWTEQYCPSKYAFLTVISMVIYLGGFASGMGSLPWVVNSEIYPLWGRGVGSGISTTCNWAVNLLISFTFITLCKLMSQQLFFLLIALFNALAILYIFLFLPETKGVPLDRVQALFEGESVLVGLKSRSATHPSLDHDSAEKERLIDQ